MNAISHNLSLSLIASFFCMTNVQADLLTSKPVADGGKEIVTLESYTVYYNGETLVSSGGNLQRNEDIDFYEDGFLLNKGWSFSVTAPKVYDHFTLSRGPNAGNSEPMNLTINGISPPQLHWEGNTFDSWWQVANLNGVLIDRSTLFFNDIANAEGMLDLGFLTTDEMFFVFDGSPDFVLTFYAQQPLGGGAGQVPEPATLAVLGLGLTGLGIAARRRRK